jgi:hypothetical protein
MAKLSAHGQKEQYRLVKEKDLPNDPLISWERETVAVMDSGKVLVKRDVIFRPSGFQPKPKRHSYGWCVAVKTLSTYAERVAYGIEKSAKGWKVVAP